MLVVDDMNGGIDVGGARVVVGTIGIGLTSVGKLNDFVRSRE